MRILFDQGTPVGIRTALRSHYVRTARQLGWGTLTNGDLLPQAEAAGFDVLVTTDQNIPHQQNFSGRKLALVVILDGRWPFLRKRLDEVTRAIENARSGTSTTV